MTNNKYHLTLSEKIALGFLSTFVMYIFLTLVIFLQMREIPDLPSAMTVISMRAHKIQTAIEAVESIEMNMGKFFSSGGRDYANKAIKGADMLFDAAQKIFAQDASLQSRANGDDQRLLSEISDFKEKLSVLAQRNLSEDSFPEDEERTLLHAKVGNIEKMIYEQAERNLAEIQSLADTQKEKISGIITRTIFLLLTLFCVIAAMTYRIIRSIVTPLVKLRDAAMEIDKGNLNKKVYILSRDELGDLASIINNLTAKLQSSYLDQEEKIAEKTKELEHKLSEMEHINELMVGREIKMIELKKEIENLRSQQK